MAWTKRQFIEQAFEEIGLASYTFDLSPEQMQAALRRLDAMMATWYGAGISLGYPLPASPQDSDLDTDTTVPAISNEAIYTNLALKIAPTLGKIVSTDTKASAKAAYQGLLQRAAMPCEIQLPGTMPAGAGNKPWRDGDAFLADPVADTVACNDGYLVPVV